MAGLDSIVVLDDEVQEVAPPKDTSGDVHEEAETESEPVALPPKQKRRLKKKTEKEADSEDVATGKELVVAPQPPVVPK
ncbi:hypothetical protein Dimus_038298 [Dionaea muscipula]